jgi:hypothetical protein
MCVAKSVLVTRRLVPRKKKKRVPSPRHRARHPKSAPNSLLSLLLVLLPVLPDLFLRPYLPRRRSNLSPFRLVLEDRTWCTNKSDNVFAEHATTVKPCSMATPDSVKPVLTFVARSVRVIRMFRPL